MLIGGQDGVGVGVTSHGGFSDCHAVDHTVEGTIRDHFALMAYSIIAR